MRLGGCCAASYSDFLVTLCSVAMKRNKLSEGKMKKLVIIFEGVEIEYQESAEGSSVSVPGWTLSSSVTSLIHSRFNSSE